MSSTTNSGSPPFPRYFVPRAIAQISRSKVARELSRGEPDLYRLVACANTLTSITEWFEQDLRKRGQYNVDRDMLDVEEDEDEAIEIDESWIADQTQNNESQIAGSKDDERKSIDLSSSIAHVKEKNAGVDVSAAQFSKNFGKAETVMGRERLRSGMNGRDGVVVVETAVEVGEDEYSSGDDSDMDTTLAISGGQTALVRNTAYDEDSSSSESDEDDGDSDSDPCGEGLEESLDMNAQASGAGKAGENNSINAFEDNAKYPRPVRKPMHKAHFRALNLVHNLAKKIKS